MTSLIERHTAALMGTYGVTQLGLVRGEGSYVWDESGKRYLDLLGGIAVNALGHAHPAWVAAVTHQAATLAHTSNFFATGPQVDVAEKLLEIAQAPAGSKVFFCNSGAEANEAAFKLARKTGRTGIVALEGSFHGRTMGALSMTYKPAIREPFEPMVSDVTFVTAGDVAALQAAVTDTTAAIILEPIQGEAGVVALSMEFMQAARRCADESGALLIFDEVQTGVARSGAWFAHQLYGVAPDIMTLAKGLGGGFPVGAVIGYGDRVSSLFVKGDHGTTFGGNPMAMAAALATLETIESESLLDNVKAVGEHLKDKLGRIPGVNGVRGEGLLLGIALMAPVGPAVAAAALEAGFIINTPAPDTVRLAPALNLSIEQADDFVRWFAGYVATHPLTKEDS